MSTPQGDPEGPPSRPPSGVWGGLWQRLTRTQRAAGHSGPAAPESTYSREALQAMIQRKRHNDLLRHREFDALRKLRHAGAASDATHVSAVHPVPFHSSMPSSPGERATTLRKIDEIEAAMSVQWRRVKPHAPQRFEERPSPVPSVLASTQPVPRQELFRASSPAAIVSSPLQAGAADFVHDPDLEEAALCFASGDMAGAERALLALLAPEHPRTGDPACWQALFDFYRATGQHGPYEDHAARYAARFQCSPPQWRLLHEPQAESLARASEITRSFPSTLPGEPPRTDWACPAALDGAAVRALQDLLAKCPQPWRLNWAGLASIEPDGLAPLAALVAQWTRQPVRLRMDGLDPLERILGARTACGDRNGDPAWWTLRMDWLRAMRRADEFELVALDYCVTYEVSPPAWDDPRCDIRLARDDSLPGSDQGFDAFESRVSALGLSELSVMSVFGPSAFAPPAAAELAGTLVGDAVSALARLDAAPRDAEVLVVSCSRLERVDFQAAAALVNWVAARQAEGRAVHFTEVHRLIAALLGAMGLSTQARITLRRD